MTPGKHRRAAWATGLSLVLHVLALTGMVVGLKVVLPPVEDRAIELQLVPRPLFRPPPEPARQPPERSSAVPALRPRPTPQPSPQASVAPLPVAPPAPAPAAKPDAGPKTYGPEDHLAGPSGRMGCDNPLGLPMTAEQRQVCANHQARLVQQAKPLDLIPEEKRAEYDRATRCRKVYRGEGIQSKTPPLPSDGSLPRGVDPSFGQNPGMGYVPRAGECL